MTVGLEAVAGLERMNINQCQTLAQDLGFDSLEFDLCGPLGHMKCQWLDAYMGLFKIEGMDGFVMVRDFEMNPKIWCRHLRPAGSASGDSHG